MNRMLLVIALATVAGTAMAQEVETDPAATAARQEIERSGYRDVRGLAGIPTGSGTVAPFAVTRKCSCS